MTGRANPIPIPVVIGARTQTHEELLTDRFPIGCIGMPDVAIATISLMTTTQPDTQTTEATATKREPLRPWNVVLLDDQEHTYDYVIDMLGRLFGYPAERGYELARTVDTQGRAIVATVHRELGELRVAQVRAFGPDPMMARSRGSMRALLEPADDGHDDGEGD